METVQAYIAAAQANLSVTDKQFGARLETD